MEKNSLSNFLEVTINTSKLTTFIENISQLINNQDCKIQEMNNNFFNVTSLFSERLKKQ